MKKIVLSLSAIAMLAMFTTSCSKSSSSSPDVQAQLVGTWNLSQVGQDANSNGKLDAGESVSPSTLGISETVTIQSGGTGTAHVVQSGVQDTTYTISWSLANQKELTISGNGETTVGTIQSISSSSLTIVTHDTSSGTPVNIWDVFSKQ